MLAIFKDDAGHAARLQAVCAAVRQRPDDQMITVRKGSVSHSHTPHDKAYKRACHPVDISELSRVLRVDQQSLTVYVEAAVTFGQLVEACLPAGCVPAVVPDMPDITVGGLLCGLGVGASSHRHGQFADTVQGAEVVLGDGRVVYATPYNEHARLFQALSGSLGTLGVVTGVAVKLAAAHAWVRAEFFHYSSDMHAFVDSMAQAVARGAGQPDFVEGWAYSPTEAVLMAGYYMADAPAGVQQADLTQPGAEYGYQLARRLALAGAEGSAGTLAGGSLSARLPAESPAPGQCAMPVQAFLFRHARGRFGLDAACRCLSWGDLETSAHARTSLDAHAAHEQAALDPDEYFTGASASRSWATCDAERCIVQQDSLWRLDRVHHALQWLGTNVQAWPVRVCPAWVSPDAERQGIFSPAKSVSLGEHAVLLTVRAEPHAPAFCARKSLAALQREANCPWLSCNLYLSPHEWSQAFDMVEYAAVRAEYSAGDALPHVQLIAGMYDEAAPAQPKLAAWQLRRAGLFWPVAIASGVGLGAAVAGALLFLRKRAASK